MFMVRAANSFLMSFLHTLHLQKKWYLDVRHTPCARSALMHGILGGAAVGLLYFLRTSKILLLIT